MVIGIGVGAFVYVRHALNTVEQNRNKASKELDSIRPMPGSQFIRRGTIAKGSHGTVTDHYNSQASYESIREYYSEEFARLGWKLEHERKVNVRDQDVGAVELDFCKDGESAGLFFLRKQESSENITYTVGTSWGLGCGRKF